MGIVLISTLVSYLKEVPCSGYGGLSPRVGIVLISTGRKMSNPRIKTTKRSQSPSGDCFNFYHWPVVALQEMDAILAVAGLSPRVGIVLISTNTT